jgi:ribosomal protein S6--L-glutamate ligase
VCLVQVAFLSDPQIAPAEIHLWLDAAAANGSELVHIPAHLLAVEVDAGSVRVLFDGKEFWPEHVVLRSVKPFLGLLETIVPLWQQHGATVLNPPAAMRVARDKLAAAVAFARAGIATPATLGFSHRDALSAWSTLDPDTETVVKPAHGSKGDGVRCFPSSAEALEALDDTALDGSSRLVAQPRLGPYGQDVRAFVVGDRCVAAMRRRATNGGFAANASLGADVEPCELSPLAADTAVAAVRALGLDYAGVDLLDTEPPMVLEANALPGMAHISAATGINPASEVLRLLQQRAKGAL